MEVLTFAAGFNHWQGSALSAPLIRAGKTKAIPGSLAYPHTAAPFPETQGHTTGKSSYLWEFMPRGQKRMQKSQRSSAAAHSGRGDHTDVHDGLARAARSWQTAGNQAVTQRRSINLLLRCNRSLRQSASALQYWSAHCIKTLLKMFGSF